MLWFAFQFWGPKEWLFPDISTSILGVGLGCMLAILSIDWWRDRPASLRVLSIQAFAWSLSWMVWISGDLAAFVWPTVTPQFQMVATILGVASAVHFFYAVTDEAAGSYEAMI